MNRKVFIINICNFCTEKDRCNKNRYKVKKKEKYIKYKCEKYTRTKITNMI